MKKKEEYYLGLDIGTDSVGAAAVNERYEPVKVKGEPVMVSHLFDPADQCAERRSFRTARRRLDRRQQRVILADEIFASEVAKVDPNFYIRKKESALMQEDKSDKDNKWLYFKDEAEEKKYYAEYPTIHHLIMDLINNEEKKFDIRLINIAVDWLVAHRGHFLFSVGEESDAIIDFRNIYKEFEECIESMGIEMPWDKIDPVEFGEILKKNGVNNKKKELVKFLYNGKIPDDEDYPINRKELTTLLAAGKVKASKLFPLSSYEEDFSFSISDDMEIVIPQLGDEADLIACIADMYDWSILSEILSGCRYISEAKVKQYETHKTDLAGLKSLVKKYEKKGVLKKGSYNEIFRKSEEKLKNYTAYSYNTESVKNKNHLPDGKASKEEFYAYLKKAIAAVFETHDEEDALFISDMKDRIDAGLFMPKQVNGDNRVIPYQLYLKA